MTRLRSRIPLAAWGLIGIALLAVCTYLLFGGRAGLGPDTFRLRFVFRSDARLTIGSPVRVAGLDVGRVTGIAPTQPGAAASLVTAEIDETALPIHRDATAKIRSRLVLEGNFYIELQLGSPTAPALPSGATIGVGSTSGPVQLDRVLTSLQSDTRTSLRTVLQGLGAAYGTPGTAVPGEDPSTAGLTGGQALNRALRDAPEALLGLARSNDAFLGIEPDDLSRLIGAQARVSAAFAAREGDLRDLIVGFEATMAAFADREAQLRAALAVLPRVLGKARPALDALDAGLPPVRAFARELEVSTRELPASIDASLPWLEQAAALLSRRELGRLAELSRPAVRASAAGNASLQSLLAEVDDLNRCVLGNLEPVGRLVVQDPPLTTGVPVFREFLQTFVGVLSSIQNFDGNGLYGRAQTGGGSFPVVTAELAGQGPLLGNAPRRPLGTRPAFPDKVPPLRYDVPCHRSEVPDVNGAKTGTGP